MCCQSQAHANALLYALLCWAAVSAEAHQCARVTQPFLHDLHSPVSAYAALVLTWALARAPVLRGKSAHLDEDPVAGPLDLAAAVDDEVAVGVLVVHGQLDQHLGVLSVVQVRKVAEVIGHWLDRGLRHTILHSTKATRDKDARQHMPSTAAGRQRVTCRSQPLLRPHTLYNALPCHCALG